MNKPYERTPEIKENLRSTCRMGPKNPNWGKSKSPETKAKLRTTHLGSKNGMWTGGQTIVYPGYVKVLSHGHPIADGYGYVFEHRLIVESIIGRYLDRKEAVHHINGKRDDNRPENLMAFKTHGIHLRFERHCSILPEDIIFDGRIRDH